MCIRDRPSLVPPAAEAAKEEAATNLRAEAPEFVPQFSSSTSSSLDHYPGEYLEYPGEIYDESVAAEAYALRAAEYARAALAAAPVEEPAADVGKRRRARGGSRGGAKKAAAAEGAKVGPRGKGSRLRPVSAAERSPGSVLAVHDGESEC